LGKGLSQLAFAGRAGCNQSFVSQVIRGDRKPPLAQIDRWVSVLGLAGVERQTFIEAANLEHATPVLREMFRRLTDSETGREVVADSTNPVPPFRRGRRPKTVK
jgi:transcriptional regulator with XRE-family HTH domain